MEQEQEEWSEVDTTAPKEEKEECWQCSSMCEISCVDEKGCV